MQKDFTIGDLNRHMIKNGFSQKFRREILQKIYPYDFKGVDYNFDADEYDIWRKLEKLNVIKIDWNYCCPCGNCDPEPYAKLNLYMPGYTIVGREYFNSLSKVEKQKVLNRIKKCGGEFVD